MNMFRLAHQTVRTLALTGVLLGPLSLAHAAELVGKPVPVGQSASSAAVLNVAPDAPVHPAVPQPPSPEESQAAENQIHQAMAEMRNLHRDHGSGFGGFGITSDVVIPVVAMLLLFGGPVILLIILAGLHYRAKARRQQNINANIDKLLAAGRDIPVELLLGEELTAVRRTQQGEVTVYHAADENMRKGVRNIGLGAGWLIFLTIMFGIKIGAFGFILIGLGISQVVIWKLSEPMPPVQAPANNPALDASQVQE